MSDIKKCLEKITELNALLSELAKDDRTSQILFSIVNLQTELLESILNRYESDNHHESDVEDDSLGCGDCPEMPDTSAFYKREETEVSPEDDSR